MAEEMKSKEPLFSPKNKKLLTTPLGRENPITVQVLGICSALAVTAKLEPSVVMTLSVIAVMAVGNLVISLLRKTVPPRIRIIVMLTVIASLVILVDQVLKAIAYDVSKQLSVFVGLIITNCIIMGRFEAFAMNNKPWPSLLDGIGNALGFFRELLGSGTLYGYQVIPESFYEMGYVNNGFFILPPMALIIVGAIIWVQRYRDRELIEEN
jgi:Na+-transporting NADH:ubiquinone oxidoreductase subunit D